MNVALTAPAATVTEAGAVNTVEALFVKVTAAPPVSAARESVTVQDVLLFADNAVKVHPIPRSVGSGCSDMVTVAVPFRVAVKVALRF